MKLLILANCQAVALTTICDGITNSDGDAIFEILPIKPTYEFISEDLILLEQHLADCDVLLYQPHRKKANSDVRLSSDYWLANTSAQFKISFHSLYFSGYNPELRYIKAQLGLHLNDGLSDYHDKRIVSLFLSGKSDDSICSQYQSMKPDDDEIVRGVQDSLAELKRREIEHNLDICSASFIEEKFQSQLLFFTFNHPANAVLFNVIEQFLLCLNISNYELPKITTELLKYDIFPIMPCVRTALSLSFDVLDNDYLIQGKNLSDKELVSRYTSIYRDNQIYIDNIKSELSSSPWLARKKVFIHIGQSTTATSDIQSFLLNASEELALQSICYPKTGVVGGAHFGISEYYLHKKTDLVQGELSPETLIDKVLREWNESGCETLILSSEMFESFSEKHIKELKKDFIEFDVSIICAVSGRLAWLSAMYHEVVKKAMFLGSFDSFLSFDGFSESSFYKLNTMFFLKSWLESFASSVKLVLLEPHSTILSDILSAFSINNFDNAEDYLTQKVVPVLPVDSISIEVLRLFFIANGLSNIPYAVASHFMSKVDYEIKKRSLITVPSSSFFHSDEQIQKVISLFIYDDLSLLRHFGFSRNDMKIVPTLIFLDQQHANTIYHELADEILQWYEQLSKNN